MIGRTQNRFVKRAAQVLSLLLLVLLLGSIQAFPTSSDPGEDGRWVWDEGAGEFFPESVERAPRQEQQHFISADAQPSNGSTPVIEADPFDEWIYGWDWPSGNLVHVCVDSSGFAGNPMDPGQCDIYHDTQTSDVFEMVVFDTLGIFDLQAGQYISMTDGSTYKDHQVTSLTVAGADAATDEVTGTADPGTQVEVFEYGAFNSLLVSADASGDWVADFTGTIDLQPGDDGDAVQYDLDGDYTWVYWSVPDPFVRARPATDRISGFDWPEGETVHICVDDGGFAADPSDPSECDLFYEQVVIPPASSWGTYFNVYLDGTHDLYEGDYIAVTDGETTREHEVTGLTVTGVVALSDIVSGTAVPFSAVFVYESDGNHDLSPIADGSGDWSANFSALQDLVPGSQGFARQEDSAGNQTWVDWEVLNPLISALPHDDYIHGYDWPEGQTVHVCVDDTGFAVDPTNPLLCDLFYATAVVPPADPWGTFIFFNLAGIHDLTGGDYIAMTDGSSTKQHQVTNLVLTGVDHLSDTVSGTADPLSSVEVWVHDCTNCFLNIDANGSGLWIADFSTITVDILPGDTGSATQTDVDDDETVIYWSIPEYALYLPLITR